MCRTGRIFKTLLAKNFLIRSKHFFLILFGQVLLPCFLFLIGIIIIINVHPSNEADRINKIKVGGVQSKDELVKSIGNSSLDLHYAPKNNFTADLIQKTLNCLQEKGINAVGESNEKEIDSSLQKSNSKADHIGLVFANSSSKVLEYKFKASDLPNDLYSDDDTNGWFKSDGRKRLTALQLCLDESFINKMTSDSKSAFKISIKAFESFSSPEKHWRNDVPFIVGLIFTFKSFLIILIIEVSYLLNERNSGMSFLMSINGVKYYLNLLSWYLSAVLWSFVYITPMIMLMKFFKLNFTDPLISHGDILVVATVLPVHICHLLSYGYQFVLSWSFKKEYFSVLLLMLVSSVITILHIILEKMYCSREVFICLGIFFPDIYWNLIFDEIVNREYNYTLADRGVSWGNLFTNSRTKTFGVDSIGGLTVLSLLGIILNLLLAIFMQNIFPGKYGIPKYPLYFSKRNKKVRDSFNCQFENNGNEFEVISDKNIHPEIEVKGLKKVFSSVFSKVEVAAIKKISINFYRGEITSLLGHNGAGKSTLLSILCGLTDMSEGIITIDGKDIEDDPSVISRSIGFCPQENLLFQELSVEEQLKFFGSLGSAKKTRKQLQFEVDLLLARMNMTDKMESKPKQLSGGQQRRLSLAMSLIGDKNIIILDEPSAGLDPQAKREVWDILMKLKREKTIIITTHDMEEADILGDRVAIMSDGELKCQGTQTFLKKHYGLDQIEISLAIEPSCNPTSVYHELGFVPEFITHEYGKLILTVANRDTLAKSLDRLETNKEQLGITGISVSLMTLEQVFIKALGVNEDDLKPSNYQIRHLKHIRGFRYSVEVFLAYFIHKLRFCQRNLAASLLSIVMPSLMIPLLYFIFNYNVDLQLSSSSLQMDSNVYANSFSFLYANDETIVNHYKRVVGRYERVESPGEMLNAIANGSSSKNVIISSTFNGEKGNINAEGFYSSDASYSVPISINCLTNVLIKFLTGDDSCGIRTFTQLLPSPRSSGFEHSERYSLINYLTYVMFLLFWPTTLSFYITQPLVERKCGIRQLQNMTAAPMIIYWVVTYVFDFIRFIISSSLFLSLMILIDYLAMTNIFRAPEIITLARLLILFGAAALPFVYVWSFINKSLNFVKIMVISFPTLIYMLHSVLRASKQQWFVTIFKFESPTLQFFLPHLNFFDIFNHFFTIATKNGNIRSLMKLKSKDFVDVNYSNEIGSYNYLYFIGSATFYWLLIIALEMKCFQKIFTKSKNVMNNLKDLEKEMESDEMVQKEKNLIMEKIKEQEKSKPVEPDYETDNTLLAHNLSKSFGNIKAVNGVSFRVKRGECFALLGVNGAGKSTTFSMITGVLEPDTGKIYLNQSSIKDDRKEYLSELGYCPQQHVLIDSMNSYDHLHLFGMLRGVPSSQIDSVVDQWIKKLDLTRCASQPSRSYSGGNKRRLNIGIALIGNPSIVLMDEPTAGVDPISRKALRNTLKHFLIAGQSIIFNSHDMAECEALCNRLVIMVNRKIACVGASEEVKQRFDIGYNIHVKILQTNNLIEDVALLKAYIEQRVRCKIIDENSGFISYHVKDPDASWKTLYSIMNEAKLLFSFIQDFSILSSTLEQLFIQFARSASTDANSSVYTISDKK